MTEREQGKGDQGNDGALPSTEHCPPEMESVGRKHPVHQPALRSGNQAVIVFVTVNAEKKKPILAKGDAFENILRAWKEAEAWMVGRYVVMPDHVHLFCAPRELTVPLRKWVKYWKSRASQRWPRPEEQPVWQIDFWDTQLRRSESYAAKWDYVWRNPVRRGLVKEPEQWPYAGELNVLMWHDR